MRAESSRDKAGTAQHCQMGRVRRARRRGVREEPAFTSRNESPAPTWRIWAGCGAHPLLHYGAGNSWAGLLVQAREATVKACGVTVAMPPGQSRTTYCDEWSAVNVGTVPVPPTAVLPARMGWLGPPSADRAGTGRSRRSTRSRGEPGTGGRAAAVTRRDRRLQCRKTRRRTAAHRTERALWAPLVGYWRCRPSFTVGQWPIPAACSTTCLTSCTTRRR